VFLADEPVVSEDELFPLGELPTALAAAEARHVKQEVVCPSHPVILLQLHVTLDAARHLATRFGAEQSGREMKEGMSGWMTEGGKEGGKEGRNKRTNE
jgi:hypothetical protein